MLLDSSVENGPGHPDGAFSLQHDPLTPRSASVVAHPETSSSTKRNGHQATVSIDFPAAYADDRYEEQQPKECRRSAISRHGARLAEWPTQELKKMLSGLRDKGEMSWHT